MQQPSAVEKEDERNAAAKNYAVTTHSLRKGLGVVELRSTGVATGRSEPLIPRWPCEWSINSRGARFIPACRPSALPAELPGSVFEHASSRFCGCPRN